MSILLGANSEGRNLPRLKDAMNAGPGVMGEKCILIVTDGDSAFAWNGLNILGNEYYGVYQLSGALLNVRDVPAKQVQYT